MQYEAPRLCALSLCPGCAAARIIGLAGSCPRQLVKRRPLLSPLALCLSHVAKLRRHIRFGIRSEACGQMMQATFSHRRSVLSMLCLTMQQQQRRSAQHQRHRSHRWNAQLLQQHLKARISLWISATQTQAMQRFLRNPWQRYVPLLRDSPYVEPCWCAHLHSLGLYGGAMMTSYVEGRLQEQAGRYRRHSV